MIFSRADLPLLLLDFDGTICVGDDAVRAYAELALQYVPYSERTIIESTLNNFLSGDLGPQWEDGYKAVKELTAPHISSEQLSRAYQKSRELLQHGALHTSCPEGLTDFLASLEGKAQRFLVTNAPTEGVAEVLDQLDLTSVIDHVINDADKPRGWDDILPKILIDQQQARHSVSVGDSYSNDLAPLIPRGLATALINRFGVEDYPEPPTWSVRHFPELYSILLRWFTDPHEKNLV